MNYPGHVPPLSSEKRLSSGGVLTLEEPAVRLREGHVGRALGLKVVEVSAQGQGLQGGGHVGGGGGRGRGRGGPADGSTWAGNNYCLCDEI